MMKQLQGYYLMNRLGTGASGEVYQALQPGTGTPVAIKILSDLSMLHRFQQEARILKEIQHQSVVHYLDFFRVDDKVCLVMEYVEGLTLEKLLQHYGKLPVSYALNILQQIARALQYLHLHGIIHRDLKAGNIMINRNSEIKLLDFGIARDADALRFTKTGCMVGSTPYVAPEQLKGIISYKMDLWALGVLYYQMLSGHFPFSAASDVELQHRICKGKFMPVEVFNPGVGLKSKKILRRLLRVDQASRWDSAQLSDFLQQEDTPFKKLSNWLTNLSLSN